MSYLQFHGWSVGIEFHLYKDFSTHCYACFGVRRWALVVGAITLDLVLA